MRTSYNVNLFDRRQSVTYIVYVRLLCAPRNDAIDLCALILPTRRFTRIFVSVTFYVQCSAFMK